MTSFANSYLSVFSSAPNTLASPVAQSGGKRVRRLLTRTRLFGADRCAPLPTLSDFAADPRKVARGQCAMSSAAAGDFAHLRRFHMTGTRSSILLKLPNGRGGP